MELGHRRGVESILRRSFETFVQRLSVKGGALYEFNDATVLKPKCGKRVRGRKFRRITMFMEANPP